MNGVKIIIIKHFPGDVYMLELISKDEDDNVISASIPTNRNVDNTSPK